MAAKGGKRAALFTVLAALVVALGVVALSWNLILEQWWLRQLSSDDEAVQLGAAEALADLKSARAVPRLVEMIRKSEREAAHFEYSWGLIRSVKPKRILLTPLAHCLYRIGVTAKKDGEETPDFDPDSFPTIVHDEDDHANNAVPAVLEAWKMPKVPVERAPLETLQEAARPSPALYEQIIR